MTNLAEFSDYYLRSIWREGDQSLEKDLPKLISEAEARISRDFRDSRITMTAQVLTTGTEDSIQLPSDFKELLSVEFVSECLARAVSYDALMSIRRQEKAYRRGNILYYAVNNGAIHFARWDNGNIVVTITYYAGVPPFPTAAGATSFYDRHPDFFMAALNAQTYKYLRDFELSAEYNQNYLALLEDMRRESNYIMYPSGQLTTPLSSLVR